MVLNNVINNKRGGTVILMTVLILMSIVGVTIMASETIRLGMIAGRTQADATKAFFAAEAGAERALYTIRKDNLIVSCLNPQKKFCFDNYPSGNFVQIIAGSLSCINIGLNCNTLPSGVNERQGITSSNSDYVIWATSSPAGDITIKSRGYNRDTRRMVELNF